jgi:hypothetical protein
MASSLEREAGRGEVGWMRVGGGFAAVLEKVSAPSAPGRARIGGEGPRMRTPLPAVSPVPLPRPPQFTTPGRAAATHSIPAPCAILHP